MSAIIRDGSDYWASFLRNWFEDGNGCFAVITHGGYMDESGTHDSSPLTIVGGYLFDAAAAAKFQEECNKILLPFRERGITYFHATDCASGDRPFDRINYGERLSLFRQLVDLIRETAHLGFFSELESSVYEAWRAENPTVNTLVGSKYAACCFHSLLFLHHHIFGELNNLEEMHYFFERIGEEKGKGHPFDRERDELLAVIHASPSLTEAFRFSAETRAKKGEVHALEAADLMVWTYSSIRRPLTDFTKISRQVFAEGRLRHRYSTVTPSALSNIARLNNDYQIRENTYAGKVRVFKF